MVKFVTTAFKVVAVVFMVVVIATIGYVYNESRRKKAANAITSRLTNWSPHELGTKDGAMLISLATRCQDNALNYRVTLSPPTKLPERPPAWLTLTENYPATSVRVIDVPGEGLVFFQPPIDVPKLRGTALLHAARFDISKLSVVLQDSDSFNVYGWDVTSFTQLTDAASTVAASYEAEGSEFCAPELYQKARSWTFSWNESPD